MPREPLVVSAQGDFNADLGVYVTEVLTCPLVGNIRVTGAIESGFGPCPPDSFGLLNSSMAYYGSGQTANGYTFRADPYTQGSKLNPGKPSNREIYGNIYRGNATNPGGLALEYGVGGGAIKRWFDMRSNDGKLDPRNCVSTQVIGKRFYELTDNRSAKPAGTGQQERVMLAAALCVVGGLKADPWYKVGGGKNKNIPFVIRVKRADIAACIRFLLGCYDGQNDAWTQPPLSSAWVQMTVEPAQNGKGWEAVVLYLVPGGSNGSDPRPIWEELPDVIR